MIPNLAAEFYQTAQAHPSQIALHLFPENQQWTFAQVQNEIDQYRAGLKKHFKFQDQVFILLRPSSELFFILMACLAEGIIPFLVDPRINKKSWLSVLKKAKLKGIIAEPELLKWKWAIPNFWKIPSFSRGPQIFLSKGLGNLKQMPTSDQPLRAHQALHTSLISLTSGSSGEPKLIERNFQALFEQQRLAKKYLPKVSRDFHLPGYVVSLLQSLCENAKSFFSTQPSVPATIDLIKDNSITRLSGPPGFILKIVRELQSKNEVLESVESILIGGAPISWFQIQNCHSAFPKAKITVIYGATEAEPISFIENPELADFDLGYPVGPVIPEVELLKRPVLLKNAEGAFEVGLKGPHVVGGGPHWTGDLAMENQGRLQLVGRISEVVEYQGHQYSVAIWEAFLEGRYGVQRIACIQQDASLAVFYEGEKVDTAEVLKYLKALWPGQIVLKNVAKIPVDARHEWKIQRRELKNL